MPRHSYSLFPDIEFKPTLKRKTGRCENLDAKRNECLIDRYCFYVSFYLRYDVIVKMLGKDFWLSDRTIYGILNENGERIVHIKKLVQSKKALAIKWPHLNWDKPDVENYF